MMARKTMTDPMKRRKAKEKAKEKAKRTESSTPISP
jgi:hypothetical protein